MTELHLIYFLPFVICSCRKITVEDVSRKHMMDVRLLHGVAYGHPWFGRWGYRFCRGSFGVKERHYDRALEILCSLELDEIIQDFSCTERCKQVKHIICCYRELSSTKLITMRDLLRFILTLKSRAEMKRAPAFSKAKRRFSPSRSMPVVVTPVESFGEEKTAKHRKFSTIAAYSDSRWPVRRLEYTANVIVDALKMKQAVSNLRMNRQEVRDAARQHIGDTGLIDYVLKSLNNVLVGNYIVRRMVNKATRKLEFSIQEVKKSAKFDPKSVLEVVPVCHQESGNDVYDDVSYLYANVLLDYPESEAVDVAAMTVLNSKYFVKEWLFRDEQDYTLRFICRLKPNLTEMEETELTKKFPIREYIEVPPHSTIGDLKLAIQNAMRDTYCIMEHFVVTDIEETEGKEDDEVLFGVLESGSEIGVRGIGLDLGADLRYEGEAENWKVQCSCGAEDDDGERMIACDMCEIWQHTRCCGIEDSEAVPPVFMCDACRDSMAVQPTYAFEPYDDGLMPDIASSIYYPEACLLTYDCDGGAVAF